MTDDVQDLTIEDAPEATEAPVGTDKPKSVPVVRRPSPANLRRQAKKEAARRAAEARRKARRRRQALSYSGVAAVVVVVLVAGWLLLGGNDKDKSTASTGASGSASASAPANTPAASVSTPAELSQKPTVTKGEGSVTALKVTPLVTGTGPKVTSGQTITVNYVGVTYVDGKQFDASWDNGSPFTTQIGVGKVIQGWDQGLVGQTVGSRVQLDIPSNLAYGDSNGSGPSGALRFVVDILAAQ